MACCIRFAFFLLVAVLGSAPGQDQPTQSETFKHFQLHWAKGQKAYAAKQYQEAIAHYEQVCAVLPFEPTSRFQLACCHAQLNQEAQALAALKEAIAYGWADVDRLKNADDLKSLWTNPTFLGLLDEAKKCSEETAVIYAGKGIDPKRPSSAIILLHGLGSGPRSEVPYWKNVADDLGFILIAPKSPIKVNAMLYGWHRPGAKDSQAADYYDLPKAKECIEQAIKHAKEKYTLEQERFILAGFSQGGGVALQLLTKNPEKYSGAVAVCSLCQTIDVASWRAALGKQPFRVALLTGKLDKLHPRTLSAFERLKQAGVIPLLQAWEGVGHEYPSDYRQCLNEALSYVSKLKK